jgi:hypothetical protein
MTRYVDTTALSPYPSLPLDFIGLCQRLGARGWRVHTTTDNHIESDYRHRVSAERSTWNGLSCPGYHWAYMSEDNSEEAITAALLKVATLCITLETVFSDCFPHMHVDSDGLIHESETLTALAKQGNDALLFFLCKHRADLQTPTPLGMQRGFIHFNWGGQSLLFSQTEVEALDEMMSAPRFSAGGI